MVVSSPAAIQTSIASAGEPVFVDEAIEMLTSIDSSGVAPPVRKEAGNTKRAGKSELPNEEIDRQEDL
jgi:hypothetical protein